jgi:hypothetical protein
VLETGRFFDRILKFGGSNAPISIRRPHAPIEVGVVYLDT